MRHGRLHKRIQDLRIRLLLQECGQTLGTMGRHGEETLSSMVLIGREQNLNGFPSTTVADKARQSIQEFDEMRIVLEGCADERSFVFHVITVQSQVCQGHVPYCPGDLATGGAG